MRIVGLFDRLAGSRRRRFAALAVAAVSLVGAATPAHADLEAVYVIPGSACHSDLNNLCSAGTWVNLLLPDDYAVCAAEQTAGQYDSCGLPGSRADLWIALDWYPGSCATFADTRIILDDDGIGFSLGSSGNTSGASSCATIDFAFTQTFNLGTCPGTSFQVTADVKGNASGSFTNTYRVVGSGPCAGLYDVAAIEGRA